LSLFIFILKFKKTDAQNFCWWKQQFN